MKNWRNKAVATVSITTAFLESQVGKIYTKSSSSDYDEWIFLSENSSEIVEQLRFNIKLNTKGPVISSAPQILPSLIFFMVEHLLSFRTPFQNYLLRKNFPEQNLYSNISHLLHLQSFLIKLFIFFLRLFLQKLLFYLFGPSFNLCLSSLGRNALNLFTIATPESE